MTIGCAMNVYNESLALPGAMANAEQWADDIFIFHTGPNGKASTDGTMELLEKSGINWRIGDINRGYGKIRTELIHRMKTDWVIIMDADERIGLSMPLLSCQGEEKYPEHKNPNVRCSLVKAEFDAIGHLRHVLKTTPPHAMAYRMCRRHWFNNPDVMGTIPIEDYHPCQNWNSAPDWQLRCVRNSPYICFDPDRKMHEHLKDTRIWSEPVWESGDTVQGPFFDHSHCWFKPLSPEKNAEDMETYKKLDESLTRGMWLEEAKGVKV